MRRRKIQQIFLVQSEQALKGEGRNAEGVVNYLLAGCSGPLYENPTVASLVKNFIVLYGI